MPWSNRKEERKRTPSAQTIYKYWAKKGLPPAKDHDWTSLEERTCFACGSFYPLHRAHIVPICFGGPNTVDNIHLLCMSCHSRSEGNTVYWTWFANMRKNEWKDRAEWAVHIMKMNGVDLEAEYKKREHLDWKDYFKSLEQLLRDNGIGLTPMDPDDDFYSDK